MANLLAHIKIKTDRLEKWESIMQTMVSDTFQTETGVIRYEYWKGQERGHYYCLLCFEDKWAFYRHQISDHHEAQDFADVIEDIRLEYIDPVQVASTGVNETRHPPLPADADGLMKKAQELFPIDIAPWWAERK